MDSLCRKLRRYFFCCAAMAAAALIFLLFPLCARFSTFAPVFIALLGILILFFFGYLPRYLVARTLCRKKEGLFFRRGVFFRRETFLPDIRVLTRSVTKTPLMRRFGLSVVCLRFASGRLLIFAEETNSPETLLK